MLSLLMPARCDGVAVVAAAAVAIGVAVQPPLMYVSFHFVSMTIDLMPMPFFHHGPLFLSLLWMLRLLRLYVNVAGVAEFSFQLSIQFFVGETTILYRIHVVWE